MFQVFVDRSGQGRWERVETLQVMPQGWMTSVGALKVAAPHMRAHPALLGLLEQEAADRPRSKDAIGVWAADAMDREIGIASDGNGDIQWWPSIGPHERRHSVTAWHEKGGFFVALPEGVRQIQVRWHLPPEEDYFIYERHARFPRVDLQETILDWRTYAGAHCSVVDGWTRMRRRGAWLVATLVTRVPFIIGQVLRRRVEHKVDRLVSDPAWKLRLTEQQVAFQATAYTFPPLTQALPPQALESVIVFVHGTASCGIGCLKPLLDAGNWYGVQIFRFEHDTFLTISNNAAALVDLILEKLPVKRILLVAHSRGGLVAKMVAARLQQIGSWPGAIDVITLGTPHQGTPLVDHGEWMLNSLSRLSAVKDGLTGLTGLSPKQKALTYLVQSSHMPLGLEEMRPGGPTLEMLSQFCTSVAPRTRAWGSAFQVDGPHMGYGVMVDPLLDGLFGVQPHDLVVPTESAEGFGAVQVRLHCSHSGYLEDVAVRAAMAAFQ